MKANVKNLVKVVEISANAHNLEFRHEADNQLIYVFGINVPTLEDMRTIAESFFGRRDVAQVDYRLNEIFFDYENATFLDKVDKETLEWALPYGALKGMR